MGQMIRKPDTNPVLVAACNLLFGAVGYYLMGQEKKAILSGIIWAVAFVFTCGMLALPWILITAYDAYLLGQKLQSGQQIGLNENGLPFLNNVFKE